MTSKRFPRSLRRWYPSVAATVALAIALVGIPGVTAGGLLITSKDVKNNSLISADLRKGAVRSTDIGKSAVLSADIRTGAVQSSDIGAGEVEPQDVTMPVPQQAVLGHVDAPVTETFTHFATVAAYQKVQAESLLEVSWSGVVSGGPGTNCVFQVRVNGLAPSQGGGEVAAWTEPESIAATVLFAGIPAGPVSVEVWARESANLEPPTCVIDPSNPGVTSTFVIAERVV